MLSLNLGYDIYTWMLKMLNTFIVVWQKDTDKN